MQLNMVIAILDRDKRDQLQAILKSLKLKISITMLGHGTATPQHLLLSGLSPKEKAIVGMITDPENTYRLMKETKRSMFVDIPGNGIIMSIPIKSIGGARTLAEFAEHQTAGEGKPDLTSYKNELIYVILNEGHYEEVMQAAWPAGATGGTVIPAKGTGIHLTKKFMSMTLANEKEVILIVASTEKKADIMRAIVEKAGPDTPAGAICFSLPVTHIAGLRKNIEEMDE